MDSVTLGGIVTLAAGVVWYGIQSRMQSSSQATTLPVAKNVGTEPDVADGAAVDELRAFRGLRDYQEFMRLKGATRMERKALLDVAIRWLLLEPVESEATNEA